MTRKLFYQFILYKEVQRLLVFFGLSKKRIDLHVKASKKFWISKFLKNQSDPLIVKFGPFEGLKYPFRKSLALTLLPKILGVYEKELHPIINELKMIKYDSVVNIGCAEGYYLAGLAMVIKSQVWYAVDSNKEAIKLSKKMLEENRLSNDIRFLHSSNFDFNEIPGLEYSRSLIFSDCEGHEYNLFNENNLYTFSNADLIIETHDFIIPGILSNLIKLFFETHHIEIIESGDNRERLKLIFDSEFNSYRNVIKEMLISEERPCKMYWLYLKSKLFHEA